MFPLSPIALFHACTVQPLRLEPNCFPKRRPPETLQHKQKPPQRSIIPLVPSKHPLSPSIGTISHIQGQALRIATIIVSVPPHTHLWVVTLEFLLDRQLLQSVKQGLGLFLPQIVACPAPSPQCGCVWRGLRDRQLLVAHKSWVGRKEGRGGRSSP